MWLHIFRLLAPLWLVLWMLPVQAVVIEGVRYNRLPDKVEIIFEVSDKTSFKQFDLSNPPRIVLDFPASAGKSHDGLMIHQGAVKGVRTGLRDKKTLRAVVDLNSPAKANIYTRSSQKKHSSLVVVEVYDDTTGSALALESMYDGRAPEAVFAGGPLPSGQSAQNVSLFNSASIVRENTLLPSATSQYIQVETQVNPQGKVVQQTLTAPLAAAPFSRKTIVVAIDPGHGGKDPGARSVATGLLEKVAVLQIGKRLRDAINAKPGFRAIMTRDKDVYVELSQRRAIARANNADVFVSIHADAVENNFNARGSSVYILSTKGATSQLAKYLAKKENAVDLRWGVDVNRYDEDVQQALLDMQQDATLEASHILAKQTIEKLGKIGNVHKSNVERANFVVLRSPDIPSMLVETAFISNPSEAKLLASPSYQQKLAQGIADGIELYFKEHMSLNR